MEIEVRLTLDVVDSCGLANVKKHIDDCSFITYYLLLC